MKKHCKIYEHVRSIEMYVEYRILDQHQLAPC
jgi:hypothetical protein